MKNYIKDYYQQILDGTVVVSKRVKKVYSRLVDDIDTPKGHWIFDNDKALMPIEFTETFCKHSQGEWMGRDVELELFQKAFISALFGFVHKDTGSRKYKETMFLVARKNGKSTLLSCLMLYMLIADGEGGAQVVSAATKKEQAAIVFGECINMVSQSADLRPHIKKRKTDLYFPLTYSTMKTLSSDSNTLDGLNIHLAVIDELHAIKDRNLYEVLKQGMSARQQPLLAMITTAGTVRESIYDDIYDYAVEVADGIKIDERFLPILYELDKKEEWTDWNCWQKANPGLGAVKKIEFLMEQVERAKNNKKDLPGILTKDFNVRETVAGAWLSFEDIRNDCRFDIEDLRGSYAVGGVDLSSTTDLTCANLIVMKPGDKTKYIIQQYFLPDQNIEQRIKEDRIPYDIYVENGLLTLTEGARVDYMQVEQWFLKMVNEYDIRPLWIGFDPWNSQYFTQRMEDHGFTMEIVRQGARTLSTPMKELAAEFMDGNINYNKNPVLMWNLTNVGVKYDENGNMRPIKGVSQKARIDGAVALIVAFTVFINNMEDYMNMV